MIFVWLYFVFEEMSTGPILGIFKYKPISDYNLLAPLLPDGSSVYGKFC